MLKGSITLRLLSSFALAFFIMSLILLHLTNDFLREATDRSQSAVYAQKVDAILGALERKARQAYFPAMAVVDQERFKMSVVKTLRELHYTYSFQVIYPVIIDRGGGVVMHPKYLYGDRSLADREYIRKGLKLKEGQFHFVSDNGEENWFFFKYFEAWDWVVGYVAPLDAKYADVKQFLGALVIAVLVLTPLILLALWFIINKTTRPLIRLTRFSSRMAEGDLDQRIEIPGGGEIGELARAFAHMRDSMRRKVSELERENAENKKTMVTLRKNEEKLLTLNQELEYERFQLLTIFDSITAMIDVIDIDSYTVLFMNKHGRELYGEDAVGRQCHEVFYDLESICDSCTNEMMLKQKGEPYHFEYHNRKLDRYFLSTNRIIKWSDGRDVKFTISLDITDRKKTEEELRNSEESSRQILASSPIGVGIARIKDGMIMFTNTRNAEHLGCA
ncbi:MAG: HAMP domain-containing protein, partial [Desulfobacterales bacterium]|nr:HAMP domain-containing protein [Desulfobacterales bacterium]